MKSFGANDPKRATAPLCFEVHHTAMPKGDRRKDQLNSEKDLLKCHTCDCKQYRR